jgi:glycosyltransferase involved in cell wall biosynthesis
VLAEHARVAGVTLVMPMYNEAADIAHVLASIRAQTYPHDALYLLVVDGRSSDGSAAIARAWFDANDIAGDVLVNPRRRIPSSLNLGFAHARPGDYVVRLDAHTTYDPDYIAAIVRAFEEAPARVACVGGPQVPAPSERFDHTLVGTLHTNPMGLGGAHIARPQPQPARSVYLGAWRPGVVESVGGFDERWIANEDSELAARLRRHGFETREIPLRSAYRIKRGPLATVKQWAGYGYWRAQTLRRHPAELRIRHLVPPLALLVAALLLATPWRPAVGVLYAAYIAGVFARRAAGEPFAITLASCVFFPATQIAWTFGLIRGLLAPRRRR